MKHRYKPDTVLFSPTAQCNLRCAHCTVTRYAEPLSIQASLRFLKDCHRNGIKKVGFTGGEPFLKPHFLYALSKEAITNEMIFDTITTNGVWFSSKKELYTCLKKLFDAGYDGKFNVSIDVFHKQSYRRVVLFIKTVLSLWKRDDMVAFNYVTGYRDYTTRLKLKTIARLLNSTLYMHKNKRAFIRGEGLFIRLQKIELCPSGSAQKLKDPWNGTWFIEDYCRGPGNVLYVLANGDVSPCCGYASEENHLKIGTIYKDSVKKILRNAQKNIFVSTVFSKGLTSVRKELEKKGIIFAKKTSHHCYFCWYILTHYSECIDST